MWVFRRQSCHLCLQSLRSGQVDNERGGQVRRLLGSRIFKPWELY